ncbi:hypothetical protein L1049_003188 [Liquidambar formosana]|uniref:Rad21/Rec8-like protein C-terminal eukaryotic domain-containing protein n=1 Tax=Liquidambar formosana TaxID=63359 RepID=A0AAP0NJQ3_LIQFO
MEEDVLHRVPVDGSGAFRDPGPSNQTNERINEDNSPQNFREIEVMRDAVHDYRSESLPIWPDLGKDITEPHRPIDQIMNEKEIPSPIAEDILIPGGPSLPFQQRSEPPASAASEEAPDIFDTHTSYGHLSPELAIPSTPPAELPKPKSRKRKQLFDESTVLSNKFMKKALEDSHDLLRKRRNIPCSLLGVWKLTNRLRKEQMFLESSMTGLCADLHDISKEDFVSLKPHLVVLEEAYSDPNPVPDLDVEIECLRQYEADASSNVLPELVTLPSAFMPTSFRREDFTPISDNNLGLGLEAQGGTTIGIDVLPTPDLGASTEPLGSDMETPMTFLEERLGGGNTGLSDIPELMNSAGTEELNFLEADNNTPTGSQGTQSVDTLSVRTRAVAQYLKKRSPITQISEDLSGDLSLNHILEGKLRKLCARMFFETLVLKSYGLVDVQQEEPYGDITLKLTPTLKAQF